MALIQIQDFIGSIPMRSKRLLDERTAAFAQNCNLERGELSGFSGPQPVHQFDPPLNPEPVKVFRVLDTGTGDEHWLSSQHRDAEIIQSPLVDDSLRRWYLFEPDAPVQVASFQELQSGQFSKLAFDYPQEPPVLELSDPPEPPSGEEDDPIEAALSRGRVIDRVYLYTFVTEWGEESMPSPSASISVPPDADFVRVKIDKGNPEIEGREFAHIRVYRSVTGAAGGQLYFLVDIPFDQALVDGFTVYEDSQQSKVVALNDSIQSWVYEAPPDGLRGARVHPSGSIVAFKGRDVYFSEAYRPHAWPSEWKLTMADEVVAVEILAQMIIVLTKSHPVIVYGERAEALGMMSYSFPMPCLSYGSVVAFPDAIFYASTDGLVAFSQNGPRLMTQKLLTKTQWQGEYRPAEINGARFENRYIGFWPDGNGFLVERSGRNSSIVQLTGFPPNSAASNDLYNDDVHMVSGNTVLRFSSDQTSKVDYVWRSKEFVSPRKMNFAAFMAFFDDDDASDGGCMIDPNTGVWACGTWDEISPIHDGKFDRRKEVLVKVYADGHKVFEGAVRNQEFVRMPSGFKAYTWYLEITGQCRLYSVTMTDTGKGQADA